MSFVRRAILGALVLLGCSCTTDTVLVVEVGGDTKATSQNIVALRFFVGVKRSVEFDRYAGVSTPNQTIIGIDRDLSTNPYRLLLHPGELENNRFKIAVAGLNADNDVIGFGHLSNLVRFSQGDAHLWSVILTETVEGVRITNTGCLFFPEDGTEIVINAPGDRDCNEDTDSVCPQCKNVGRIYWSDYGTGVIQSADLDGIVNPPIVSSGLDKNYGMAFDHIHNKVYWVDYGTGLIESADPDGENRNSAIITGVPRGVAVDPFGKKVYWADSEPGIIWRANLDLSGIESWIENLGRPFGVDLDIDTGKIYWVDAGTNSVERTNLDATGVIERLHSQVEQPRGVAVDPLRNRVYWTQRGGSVNRSNLDGSDPELNIVAETTSPRDIEVDVLGAKIYWIDGDASSLTRAELDGSSPTVLIGNLNNPRGIALAP